MELVIIIDDEYKKNKVRITAVKRKKAINDL
jgi:hypothetical protein